MRDALAWEPFPAGGMTNFVGIRHSSDAVSSPATVKPADKQAGVGADGGLDRVGGVLVGFEILLGVLAALADAGSVIGEPGAGFLHDAGLDAEIEQLARFGNAVAVHDVELDLAERRRHLVLHHLDAGLVADDFVAGP